MWVGSAVIATGLAMGCNGSGGAAGSGGLTTGEYDCSTASGGSWSNPGIMAMGHMDINGGKYRFRPFDKVTDGWAGYSVGANDAVTWNGKMGGLTDAPSVITESKRTSPTSVNIWYRTKPDVLIEMMTCRVLGT